MYEGCCSLQHAHSEMGRCRAWIRLAVNECALENYIGVLCQDDSLLKYVHMLVKYNVLWCELT